MTLFHFHGTRRPPPLRYGPKLETACAAAVRPDTLPEYVHQALLHRDRRPVRCECGQPAVCVGYCTLLGPLGSELSGGLLLCAACAQEVDAGVRVEVLPLTPPDKSLPRAFTRGRAQASARLSHPLVV